jgi:NADH dehydrogenase FAD-containing subunit
LLTPEELLTLKVPTARLENHAICEKNRRILVKPTLQVHFSDHPTSKQSNIFALGDVAESGGPKMGRAGMVQAEIVRANIASLIKNKEKLETYVPIPLEGALKLSLGKVGHSPPMKGTLLFLGFSNFLKGGLRDVLEWGRGR